ncbi:hypothetical protein HK102_000884 [Quaeritorhiza haematococci]|nr:hypothetical protein HK102_000884 [Quaeritorhiza haematococci]
MNIRISNVLLLLVLLFGLTIVARNGVVAEDDIEAVVDDLNASQDDAAVVPPGYSTLSEDEAEKLKSKAQKFTFETEVNRLMKLIINSLYKTKEIFLREIISNASDAIDKIRFLSLTDKEALKENPDLKITLVADPEHNTLTITDTGVGMTQKELRENLGTIAKSGTSEFLSAVENKTADMGLIGQFGVGFYSVFLVADSVTVVTKHNSDKQYVWQSTAESDFTIAEDPRGNTLGRGTQITLHLKSDALEFLEESRLKSLVSKYSEFINFPIYLWTKKTVSEEIPDPEAEEEEEKKEEEEEVEDVDEKKDEEKKPKTKTVTKTVHEWELMNDNKPIWTRSAKEITDDEYKSFYRSFAKESSDPMSWIHFFAEGEVEFRAMLFIPAKAPAQFMQKAEAVLQNIKLYVRRVFITDELPDFLPRWLSFLKGLVDSDDLPLNVSRETLQAHAMLKIIKKKLIGKAIEMFNNLAKDAEKYTEFFKEFGMAIKLGVLEDRSANRKKLTKLLRYKSSKSEDKLISLEDYVKRMKKGQPQIYYVTGVSLEEILNSPLVEKITARGYEVLYMYEPLDEYLMQSLTEYDGHKFQNVAKTGLKYGDEDDEGEDEKAIAEKYKPLAEWLEKQLTQYVEKVVISNKLTKSPCAIVASEMGLSGTMERIMQAQAFQNENDYMRNFYLRQKKILEINPHHPIMETLLTKVEADTADKTTEEAVRVLYETTLLRSGYSMKDVADFSQRVEKVIRNSLGVDLEKQAEVKIKPAPKAEEKEEGEEKKDEDEDEEKKDEEEEGEEVVHDEL